MSTLTGAVMAGALRDRRRGLVGWPIAVGVVAAAYTVFYPLIGAEEFAAILGTMPEVAEAMGLDAIASAAGYVQATVYSLLGAVLTLVCAISVGARLIAGEEEDGTLELDLSAPVTRTRVYLERLAVLWLTVLLVVLSISAVLAVLSATLDLGLAPVNVAAASTGLWLFAGATGTVALAVGAATGRRSVGIAAASGLAVVAYLLSYLSPLVDEPWMDTWSPFSWYVAHDPLTHGFYLPGLGLLAGLALVAGVVGWVGFRRRDLRV